MRILISGICGFAGSTIAAAILEAKENVELSGFDNFSRRGSELNRSRLQQLGIRVLHADARNASDIDSLSPVDWVIDAAANPSVLAGFADSSSRQVVEHNLGGTINLLEYCKRHRAGIILLSTSRVYSLTTLSSIEIEVVAQAYQPKPMREFPLGVSVRGVSESCSTAPPISLYGSTKLASEILALEYGLGFEFPVQINRCGVLAGAGQFGRGDQGIFSYWINAWLRQRPLSYLGFEGKGYQVRDCLQPRDLVPLLLQQMRDADNKSSILNLGGGVANSISLARLSAWCADRFGERKVNAATTESRRFDVPWLVLDSDRAAAEWNWRAATPLNSILEEIAAHAESHPNWLDITT